jgi:hypothetical protein
MKKKLVYLASKGRDKVGHQELRSTPYKQEIDTRGQFFVRMWMLLSATHVAQLFPTFFRYVLKKELSFL